MLAQYICIPRHRAAPAGERISFYKAVNIRRRPDSFEAADLPGQSGVTLEDFLASGTLQQHPDTLVVLQVKDIAYDTTEEDFDPYRNWLTGLTAATVVREVPAREVVRV